MTPRRTKTCYFREQADQSRDLAIRLDDQDMRQHLLEMAERYEALAAVFGAKRLTDLPTDYS